MSVYVSVAAVLAAVGAVVFGVTRARAGRSAGAVRVAADVAFAASVVAVLSVTLEPMDADEHEVRLVPLDEILDAVTPPIDDGLLFESFSNVLLLLPFGAALALRGVRLGTAVVLGVAFAASVEVTQLLFVTGRTTSFDDVLLNTIGVFLGYRLVAHWVAFPDDGAEAGS